MADAGTPSGTSPFADATALQDIATNGALLNQATSRLIQTLERMGNIVLPATHGGTGFDSYTVGDLLYADTTSTLAKLPDVAVGKVLVSGGVGVAPAWGDVPGGSISGVVPVANGGTGRSTLTVNNLLVGDGASDIEFIAPGTNGNFLVSNGTSWAGTAAATVSQYRNNTSGSIALTPATVWSAADFVALTDAATVAIDFSAGFNFVLSNPASNRTLGNPTNVKNGQSGLVWIFNTSGASRNIDVGTNWFSTTDVSFPVAVANNTNCFISYICISSTYILVTGVLNNPT